MKPRLQEKGGKYECVQSSGDCRETKFEKAMTIVDGPPISFKTSETSTDLSFAFEAEVPFSSRQPYRYSDSTLDRIV